MDEGGGHAVALTVFLGDLHVVAPVVLLPVEVGVERDPLVLAGLQEHVVERAGAAQVGHVQRPVDAVQIRVAVDGVALGLLEVREHVVETPSGVAQLGPGVVVRPVAPGVDHGVDGAGTTQRLSPGLEPPPTVEPDLGNGLVVPAVPALPVAQGETQGGPDEHVAALTARLQQTNPDRRILAQPSSHHTPGRPATHHHIVELVHKPHRTPTPRPHEPPGAPRRPRRPGAPGAPRGAQHRNIKPDPAPEQVDRQVTSSLTDRLCDVFAQHRLQSDQVRKRHKPSGAAAKRGPAGRNSKQRADGRTKRSPAPKHQTRPGARVA